jgi:hypothetical protein
MVRQKVGGELVSPNSMTLVLYAPKGVLKAAFHRSSSLIWILLKPHLKSSLVNIDFPWRRSMMLLIRGSGYTSHTVQEFKTR